MKRSEACFLPSNSCSYQLRNNIVPTHHTHRPYFYNKCIFTTRRFISHNPYSTLLQLHCILHLKILLKSGYLSTRHITSKSSYNFPVKVCMHACLPYLPNRANCNEMCRVCMPMSSTTAASSAIKHKHTKHCFSYNFFYL